MSRVRDAAADNITRNAPRNRAAVSEWAFAVCLVVQTFTLRRGIHSGDVWEKVAHGHETATDFNGATLLALNHIDQAEAA
jgi:hypothetical protein